MPPPAQTGGELVVVHEAGHSWVLEDPETVRAIAADLLADGLGTACLDALAAAGLDPGTVSLAEVERAFYARGTLVHASPPARATMRSIPPSSRVTAGPEFPPRPGNAGA